MGFGLIDLSPGLSLRERMLDLQRIRVPDQSAWRAVQERVLPLLAEWRTRGQIVVVGVERPGGGGRRDAGPRNQAQIGEAVGWSGALVAAAIGIAPYRFRSPFWRETMLALAEAEGLTLLNPSKEHPIPKKARKTKGAAPPPSRDAAAWAAAHAAPAPRIERPTAEDIAEGRAPTRAGYVIHWRPCAHTTYAPSFLALEQRPPRCPHCPDVSAPPPPPPEPEVGKDAAARRGDLVTDGWKREAVRFVQTFAPHLVDRIVAEASENARKTPDRIHRYAGVPDACEGMGVALHAAKLHAAGVEPGIID